MRELELHLNDVGKRIMERRKKMGLTQEALAEKSGLTAQCISYAESGKRAMQSRALVKIASALGVSVDYILTGNIVDKDKMLLSEKLGKLTASEVRIVENIINECIALYHGEG